MNALFDSEDSLDAIVKELREYPGWISDDLLDRKFAAQLEDEFPGLDILAEVRSWRVWMMDHRQKKEVKPRARVYRWLRTARGDFGSSSRDNRSRSRTLPGTAEQFGATSQQLTGW